MLVFVLFIWKEGRALVRLFLIISQTREGRPAASTPVGRRNTCGSLIILLLKLKLVQYTAVSQRQLHGPTLHVYTVHRFPEWRGSRTGKLKNFPLRFPFCSILTYLWFINLFPSQSPKKQESVKKTMLSAVVIELAPPSQIPAISCRHSLCLPCNREKKGEERGK